MAVFTARMKIDVIYDKDLANAQWMSEIGIYKDFWNEFGLSIEFFMDSI